MAEGPAVWIIGADHWPRAYLRAELIERGYDAVGFVELRDAALRLALPRARKPAIIVVDLQEQLPNQKLLAEMFRRGVPVVAIAGAVHEADAQLRGLGWAAFLRRPVTIGAIADTVEQLRHATPD